MLMNAILATLTLVLRTVQTLSAVLRAAACTSGYRLGSDGFTCEGIIIICRHNYSEYNSKLLIEALLMHG